MELSKFKKNIKSQFGEDGIIEEIFNRINPSNKICIEFGAWDGEHCSNVWNLWHENRWSAVLIEADSKKFEVLKTNTKDYKNLFLVNRFVEPKGPNSVDDIIESLGINKTIDLLSIDIDGNDYYILEGLNKVKPRVIIIEYNPTIPPELDIVQEKDEYFGASALSIYKLGNKKGYKLAAITDTNLIFVLNEDFPLLNIEEVNLITDFPKNHLVYVITGFDGKAYLSNKPPYLYQIPTLLDLINKFSQNNFIFKKYLNKFLKLRNHSNTKLKTEHKIVSVQVAKD